MRIKKLSDCELQVMRVIWNSNQAISLPDIKKRLEENHQREYGRSTIATWLKRLKQKKYVESYTKRGLSYFSALITEDEYREEVLKEVSDFWFNGSIKKLFLAFAKQSNLTDQETKEIRKILDEWDSD